MQVFPSWEDLGNLRTALTDGERQFLEVLGTKLDDTWECYVQPHLNGLRPDVVVLNPYVGVAVFEVKDWSAESFRVAQRRMRGPLGDHPLWQLRTYHEEVTTRYSVASLQGRRRGDLSPVVAGLVIPTSSSDEVAPLEELRQTVGLYPTEQFPIVSADDLSSANVTKFFPWTAHPNMPVIMTPAVAESLRPFLVEPDVAARQRRPLPLTRRQRELATSRTETGYRRIKGPAGSGKSTVLAARAAELSAEGNRVLILSFNITLWHYLRDLVVRHRTENGRQPDINNIDLWHYHFFCKMACYRAGLHDDYHAIFQDHRGGGPPTGKLTQLAQQALQETGPMYDAVLVDEGQDLDPDWWQVVRAAVGKNGERLLVADVSQDLYDTGRRWTEQAMIGAGFVGDWVRLDGSHRLPVKLAQVLESFGHTHYTSEFDPPHPAHQAGLFDATLRWVKVGPEVDLADAMADEIARAWRSIDAPDVLAMADVFYVCSSNEEGMAVSKALEQRHRLRSRHTFAKDDRERRNRKHAFWAGDARIKGSTPHSLKGWEARAVVVAVPSNPGPKDLRALYVAMSRVKQFDTGSLLVAISGSSELDAWAEEHFDEVETVSVGSR